MYLERDRKNNFDDKNSLEIAKDRIEGWFQAKTEQPVTQNDYPLINRNRDLATTVAYQDRPYT